MSATPEVWDRRPQLPPARPDRRLRTRPPADGRPCSVIRFGVRTRPARQRRSRRRSPRIRWRARLVPDIPHCGMSGRWRASLGARTTEVCAALGLAGPPQLIVELTGGMLTLCLTARQSVCIVGFVRNGVLTCTQSCVWSDSPKEIPRRELAQEAFCLGRDPSPRARQVISP
jgi:hypothetical protein